MKQVTVSFKENLSDSFYYSRNVSAALYIDLQHEKLQFFSDEVLRGSRRSKREIESSPNLCVNCFRHNMQEAA